MKRKRIACLLSAFALTLLMFPFNVFSVSADNSRLYSPTVVVTASGYSEEASAVIYAPSFAYPYEEEYITENTYNDISFLTYYGSSGDNSLVVLDGRVLYPDGISSLNITFLNFHSDLFNNSSISFGGFIPSGITPTVYTVTSRVLNGTTNVYDTVTQNIIPREGGALSFSDITFSLNYFIGGKVLFESMSINIPIITLPREVAFTLTFQPSVTSFDYRLLATEIISQDAQINVFGTLVQSVNEALKTEILPGFSFWHLMAVCITIPLTIAILKLWLGG